MAKFRSPAWSTKASKASALRLRLAGIGALVEMTDEALTSGIARQRKTGRITGWGHGKWFVRVQIEGEKSISTYHVNFWKPVDVI